MMGGGLAHRSSTGYRTEERFRDLFAEAFGPAAAGMLAEQFEYRDIEGRERRIDFALETLLNRYAIEIGGDVPSPAGAARAG